MAVALRGNLKDFGIAEVFQLIGQQRKTGILVIGGNDPDVKLAFDAGSVVWACPIGRCEFSELGDQLVRSGLITRVQLDEQLEESERSARPLPDLLLDAELIDRADLKEIEQLLTRDTIFSVLRRTGGSFDFSAKNVVHDTPPEKLLAAEQILMDGLRMLDEWQTFRDAVPSDDSIFQRVGQLKAYQARVGDDGGRMENSERIFRLVDGRLTARRLIDLSRLGNFEATRVLAELRRAGLITLVEGKLARVARRGERSPRTPLLPVLRVAFATAAPLVVLAASLFGVLAFGSATSLPGQPLAMRPLAELRQPMERRALRSAIAADEYANGPAEQTSPFGTSAGEGPLLWVSLTPDEAGEYYLSQSEGKTLLLAPRR